MANFVDNITRIKKQSQDFGIPIPVRVKKTKTDFKIISESSPILRPISFKLAGQFLAGLIMTIGLLAAGWKNPTIAQGVDLYRLIGDGRYLILFQNNSELRPTGGFIGSFAIATIQNKKLADFEIETNIYHKDDQFIKEVYVPQPQPFEDWLPGKGWSLHDANWEADFEAASKDIQWFYETEYQDKIDGIMGINVAVLGDLIGLTGPIELNDYQITLTQDNFLAQLQTEIDLNYYKNVQGLKEDQPKTILKKLYPLLLEKISQTNKLKLAQLIRRELEQKDILFYFEDARQKIARQNGWSGQINQTSPNFLHINNANIGGGKSSLSTRQMVDYRLKGEELTLTISRANLPRADGFPTHTNFNYIRIYLPKGVQLLSSQLDNQPLERVDKKVEFNRNVFGFWFNTPLYQSQTARLVFQLPPLASEADFLIQKQPGAENESYTVVIGEKEIFEEELEKDLVLKKETREIDLIIPD